MFFERLQSNMVRLLNKRYLSLGPTEQTHLPSPVHGHRYLLYLHVPFCERLCPYCSFNRYVFNVESATAYFADLRDEMRMLANIGYDFDALYIGGGTPTIMPTQLLATIDLAKQLFSIKEVSCETNPNHLALEVVEQLEGHVQRLSVGVQSFDDGLLRQMDRYEKYGSGLETLIRIQTMRDRFQSLSIDMIFNFPSQTEDILINDLASVLESGANQVTFYPLMVSPSVAASLARTVGRVDYAREQYYYEMICEALTGSGKPVPKAAERPASRSAAGSADCHTGRLTAGAASLPAASPGTGGLPAASPAFDFSSAWTFNRVQPPAASENKQMIDEYIVDYEEYPAIGSGGMSYLDGSLFVNTFSLAEYHEMLSKGRMSVSGVTHFSKYDRMRYRLMMQLFGLRLDKQQWQRDFRCSVARGVPGEYLFFKSAGAIAYEDDKEIRLTPKGRYLTVALMREFFVGVNRVRDQARAALADAERELLFGEQTHLHS